MCTNQKEIYLKNGRKHIVACGKCPACQQQRALYFKSLIDNNTIKGNGYVNLFVTLTYDNRFIPYIKPSYVDNGMNIVHVPVYRDFDVRTVRGRNKIYYDKRFRLSDDKKIIDYISLSSSAIDSLSSGLPFIRSHGGYVDDKVGILYKKDIQNFYKRLRINYERNYKQQLDLSFFVVGDYVDV